MVTLKDIAKHANVSVCTVSRYLNYDIVVKKETEARIQNAIKELGYVPNVVAKALKRNQTFNVAVILPKINNLYYSEMTSGISEVLGRHHYNLFIYEVDNLHLSEEQIMQLMRENMVAGVIFIGLFYDMSFRDSLHNLLEWNIPVVYMNRYIPYEGYPLIYPDLKQAGILAAGHLIEKGSRRLALIHRHLPKELLNLYTGGFCEMAAEGKAPLVLEIENGDESMERCADRLRCANIDGVFVLNELNAVRLTKMLIKQGIRVPEDMAVLSFGNSLMSMTSTPELSCIDLQDRVLGKRSAELILHQIQKKEVSAVTLMEPQLVQREST